MQINKGKNAEWHVDAGTFNIESGSIVVSDPCYEYDTWCAGDLPAVNGTYKVADDVARLRFDSADVYGSLIPGQTYTFKTSGYRFGLFSMFPNILEFRTEK